jgi:hypothetical protein
VYTHGSGIRARRKRWLLAVAGSRTGHHLQGEVPGGMTLVFACRGPPGCSEQGYFRLYGFPLGGAPRGDIIPPGCSAPASACVVLSNGEALCHTPRGPARCSAASGLGTCQENSHAASSPRPRSGSPFVSGKYAASASAPGLSACCVMRGCWLSALLYGALWCASTFDRTVQGLVTGPARAIRR